MISGTSLQYLNNNNFTFILFRALKKTKNNLSKNGMYNFTNNNDLPVIIIFSQILHRA